jgi:hypothetical protein
VSGIIKVLLQYLLLKMKRVVYIHRKSSSALSSPLLLGEGFEK